MEKDKGFGNNMQAANSGCLRWQPNQAMLRGDQALNTASLGAEGGEQGGRADRSGKELASLTASPEDPVRCSWGLQASER